MDERDVLAAATTAEAHREACPAIRIRPAGPAGPLVCVTPAGWESLDATVPPVVGRGLRLTTSVACDRLTLLRW